MTDSKVCTHPYSVRPLLILSAQPALHRSFHRRVLTTSATPGSIVSNVQVIGLYTIPPELPIIVRLPAVARGDTAHGGDTSHLLCRTPLMSTVFTMITTSFRSREIAPRHTITATYSTALPQTTNPRPKPHQQ